MTTFSRISQCTQATAQLYSRAPPILLCVAGIALMQCIAIYQTIPSSFILMTISIVIVVLSFIFQRYMIMGFFLALATFPITSTQTPNTSYTDCLLHVTIKQANYSHGRNKSLYLNATSIQCGQTTLPNQVIQYWDNKSILPPYPARTFIITADLLPATSSVNHYDFDYEKYLFEKGIRLRAKNISVQRIVPDNSLINNARARLAEIITTNDTLSQQNAALILALITGNRAALSQEQKQSMLATGTSHLLAISGLHIGLVGAAVWLLFQYLWACSWRLSDITSPRNVGAIAALSAITVYALIAGFSVPVQRAWIMFSLLIISWLFGKGSTHNSLLAAAAIVMLISPTAIISVGFYLSFIATLVVMWSVQLPYSALTRVLILQATISMILLPLSWYSFGSISLSAPFINLLVIPWLGLWLLPCALIASAISLISYKISETLWSLTNLLSDYLWNIIDGFKYLEWLITPLDRPHLYVTIIVVSLMLIGIVIKQRFLLLSALLLFIPTNYDNQAQVIIADRKYSSTLIHNGREAIIINPGWKYSSNNHAMSWLRYLQSHNLTLSAIILEDSKLSKISSTKWLLSFYPSATVATLKKIELPYTSHYCQPIFIPNITINTRQSDTACEATINFYGRDIALFPSQKTKTQYALLPRSTIRWKGTAYTAKTLGAVTISPQPEKDTITWLREEPYVWRFPLRSN